jgi:hypothetical protein
MQAAFEAPGLRLRHPQSRQETLGKTLRSVTSHDCTVVPPDLRQECGREGWCRILGMWVAPLCRSMAISLPAAEVSPVPLFLLGRAWTLWCVGCKYSLGVTWSLRRFWMNFAWCAVPHAERRTLLSDTDIFAGMCQRPSGAYVPGASTASPRAGDVGGHRVCA